MNERYIGGLDLGKRRDFGVLCLLRRLGGVRECICEVVAIRRYALETSYASITEDVAKMMAAAPDNTMLAFDATGGGIVFFDMVKIHPVLKLMLNRIIPVSVHGGDKVSRDGEYCRVPKRELVRSIQRLLGSDRLKLKKDSPETRVLLREFSSFQIKVSARGHDSYAAAGANNHDDVISGLSLATWAAQTFS